MAFGDVPTIYSVYTAGNNTIAAFTTFTETYTVDVPGASSNLSPSKTTITYFVTITDLAYLNTLLDNSPKTRTITPTIANTATSTGTSGKQTAALAASSVVATGIGFLILGLLLTLLGMWIMQKRRARRLRAEAAQHGGEEGMAALGGQGK
jgi:hypothetical protein